MNANKFIAYLLMGFLCILQASHRVLAVDDQNIPDGNYKVGVELWNKYEDKPSMGNRGLNPEANLRIEKGEAYLEIQCLPMEFMNQRGYLGELRLDGKEGQVRSEYEEFDAYNDIDRGKDPMLKGKKYPKNLEFQVDLNKKYWDLSLYIPVMAEMGSGSQEARLLIKAEDRSKLSIQGQAKGQEDESPVEDKKSQGALISLAQGAYRVQAVLWHAQEDKPSMGQGSMGPWAEIISENGKLYLYLESKTMEVSNTISSLMGLHLLKEDGFYYPAKGGSYDLQVQSEAYKRPRVFKLALDSLGEKKDILLDPKVEIMGDQPIRARIKFLLDTLEKVDKASLAELYENGDKSNFSYDQEGQVKNKGSVMVFPSATFKEPFVFYSNELVGKEGDSGKNLFNKEDKVRIYGLECLTPLGVVSKEEKDFKKTQKAVLPQKRVAIKIPIKGPIEKDKWEVYKLEDSKKERIPSTLSQGYIEFETSSMGQFALLEKERHSLVQANSSKSKKILAKNGGKLPQESTPNKGKKKQGVKNLGKKKEGVEPLIQPKIEKFSEADISRDHRPFDQDRESKEEKAYLSQGDKLEGARSEGGHSIGFISAFLLLCFNGFSLFLMKKAWKEISLEKSILVQLKKMEGNQ